MTSSALVLGGGISGLAAACRLRQAGWRVELLEAASRLGGCLATHEEAGAAWELGAHTAAAAPELLELARLRGLEGELVPVAAESRRRYMVHEGRLVALPAQPLGWLASPLLSPVAGLRLVAGRLRGWPPRLRPQERLESALRRRLGPQGGSLLAASIATGVYAGEASELLAAEALRSTAPRRTRETAVAGRRGSADGRRGGRRLLRPRRGWQAWLGRAAEGLPVRLATRAVAARPTEGGFEVEAETADGRRRLSATRLVSAMPAADTARVLAPLGDTGSFAAVAHAPLATVVLAWDRESAAPLPAGFGFLDPFDATGGLLGCIFASAIAPEIAPPGSRVLTALVGGRRRAALVELADAELVAFACSALARLLGLRGEPRTAVVRRWRPGIPQPTRQLLAARADADAMESRHCGLTVLGDWLRGVGVPACVAAAWSIDPG